MQILAQAGGLVVVAKPAGMPSTPRAAGDPDCLEQRLGEHFGQPRLWAVHQLDLGTTGVNLFVLRPALVDPWHQRLKHGTKQYLALVHGRVAWTELAVEQPLLRQPDGWMRVDPTGKSSTTLLERLVAAQAASLVRCRPLTGRTHQVRVHLAYAGHPLLGERHYRTPPCERLGRTALHCWRIDLPGAPDGMTRLEAPIPEDFRVLATELGLPLEGLAS